MSHKHCRYLRRRGRFGRSRCCRTFGPLRAKGTSRWRLTILHRLSARELRAEEVQSVDAARSRTVTGRIRVC